MSDHQEFVTTDRKSAEENKASLLAYFESRRPYRVALGQKYFPDPFDIKGQKLLVAKCGTYPGDKVHLKRGEKACSECQEAARQSNREYRARKKQAAA